MRRAIAMSRRGYPAPNPHVGCVIVRDGKIVGDGFHNYAGGPHAEVNALRKAGEQARGATVYVTLEPCNHLGRTPPCVDALLAAGVSRVVAATRDPYQPAAGGLDRLRAAGLKTEHGLLDDEAREANVKWLAAIKRGYPYIVVKAASTLDGRLATPSGESKWITGELARKEAHRLRGECGAVLAGRTTVESDNPQLTVRAIKVRNQPVRIVLDPSRKLAPTNKVFDGQARTIRVVSSDPREGELRVGSLNGLLDLEELLRALYREGITSLLVEGGAHTIGSFLDAGLVDRIELFIAGKVFGAGKAWAECPFLGTLASASRFEIANLRKIGPDAWLTCFPRRASPVT